MEVDWSTNSFLISVITFTYMFNAFNKAKMFALAEAHGKTEAVRVQSLFPIYGCI